MLSIKENKENYTILRNKPVLNLGFRKKETSVQGIKTLEIEDECIESEHQFVWTGEYYTCIHCGLIDDNRLEFVVGINEDDIPKTSGYQNRRKMSKKELGFKLKLHQTCNVYPAAKDVKLDRKANEIFTILQYSNTVVENWNVVMDCIKTIVRRLFEGFKSNKDKNKQITVRNNEAAYISLKYIEICTRKRMEYPPLKLSNRTIKIYARILRDLSEELYYSVMFLSSFDLKEQYQKYKYKELVPYQIYKFVKLNEGICNYSKEQMLSKPIQRKIIDFF